MSGGSENKSEDVEMADAAPPAAEEAPKKKAAAGKAPRFEIKKWNAVVSIYLLVAILPRYCYEVFMLLGCVFTEESCWGRRQNDRCLDIFWLHQLRYKRPIKSSYATLARCFT